MRETPTRTFSSVEVTTSARRVVPGDFPRRRRARRATDLSTPAASPAAAKDPVRAYASASRARTSGVRGVPFAIGSASPGRRRESTARRGPKRANAGEEERVSACGPVGSTPASVGIRFEDRSVTNDRFSDYAASASSERTTREGYVSRTHSGSMRTCPPAVRVCGISPSRIERLSVLFEPGRPAFCSASASACGVHPRSCRALATAVERTSPTAFRG